MDAPLAGSRAQAILQPVLLRRTKNSTLDGEPLLQLPPKEIEIVKLQFTKEEKDVSGPSFCSGKKIWMVSIQIYDFFESKTKLRVNKFIKENTVVKKCVPISEALRLVAHLGLSHVFILVLILRLRQLCCHPYLTLVKHLFILHNHLWTISTVFNWSLRWSCNARSKWCWKGAESCQEDYGNVVGESGEWSCVPFTFLRTKHLNEHRWRIASCDAPWIGILHPFQMKSRKANLHARTARIVRCSGV